MDNRSFNYYNKESESKDSLLNFIELSNVHNGDRSLKAILRTFRTKGTKTLLHPGSSVEQPKGLFTLALLVENHES